jgi:hypothetical protein
MIDSGDEPIILFLERYYLVLRIANGWGELSILGGDIINLSSVIKTDDGYFRNGH